jgi:hypothetical protein
VAKASSRADGGGGGRLGRLGKINHKKENEMTKAEEYWGKFTEDWRAEQDALDAIDKDPVAKAAKAAKEAEEEAAREAKRKEPTIVVSNADNATLTPKSAGGFVSGCVDAINGLGGTEVPGYVPTRHELTQIVNFWCKEILDLKQKAEDVGGWDWEERLMEFGKRRIKRIETVLGEELVGQAIKDYNAEKAWRKKYVVRQQDIAVLRALAVKVEHAAHGMYDETPEARYTFADGSVLVTHEGYYGKTSFNVEHWFATTAEKEAFDAEMAERNVIRWVRKRGSGRMVRRPEKPAAAAPPEPLPPTGGKPVVAAAPTRKESQPV